MSNLVQGNKFILVSTIENFVADEVTNTDQPDAEITHCLRSFLKTIEDEASKLPDTKFCIVMPTHRPLYSWYQDRLKDMDQTLMDGIKAIQVKIGFGKILGVSCSPDSSQDFGADGIHFTEPSAKIFLDHILCEAEAFFKGEKSSATSDNDQDVTIVRSIEERLDFLRESLQETGSNELCQQPDDG